MISKLDPESLESKMARMILIMTINVCCSALRCCDIENNPERRAIQEISNRFTVVDVPEQVKVVLML